MSIEMTSYEIMNLLLGLLMKVLKFVHGRKLCDIETIGKHTIWFALQKMFGFIRSDVGDGCEDVARMSRCSLNAISVIDTTFASFCVHIKVL